MVMCCLQDILKHSERASQDCSELQKALHVMQVVPKAANDMMNVGRLCGFDVCAPLMLDRYHYTLKLLRGHVVILPLRRVQSIAIIMPVCLSACSHISTRAQQ